MKRRVFVKALAAPAVPGVLALPAQAQDPEPPTAVPPLQFAGPDAAGDGRFQFFDARQAASLRRLCDTLEPAFDGLPSANDARVAEFLDFYIAVSPPERQQLYLFGLDLLEHESQDRFQRSFAATSDTQAAELLTPLRQPWTPDPPGPLLAFLRDARATIRAATRNSYEWDRAGRGRGGNYWKPVE
jgi:hypothetical protein